MLGNLGLFTFSSPPSLSGLMLFCWPQGWTHYRGGGGGGGGGGEERGGGGRGGGRGGGGGVGGWGEVPPTLFLGREVAAARLASARRGPLLPTPRPLQHGPTLALPLRTARLSGRGSTR